MKQGIACPTATPDRQKKHSLGGFKYFYFRPYLGKIPILTNIFQMGWLKPPTSRKLRFVSIWLDPQKNIQIKRRQTSGMRLDVYFWWAQSHHLYLELFHFSGEISPHWNPFFFKRMKIYFRGPMNSPNREILHRVVAGVSSSSTKIDQLPWRVTDSSDRWSCNVHSPIQSMYGIFTYIYHKNQPNVGKYTIHGSYGTLWKKVLRWFLLNFGLQGEGEAAFFWKGVGEFSKTFGEGLACNNTFNIH